MTSFFRVFNGKHYLAVLDLKDRLEKYHNIDTAAEIKVKTCITTILVKSRI